MSLTKPNLNCDFVEVTKCKNHKDSCHNSIIELESQT